MEKLWIHGPDLIEARKLQIAALQLEELSQTWWDTKQGKTTFMIELVDVGSSATPPIK